MYFEDLYEEKNSYNDVTKVKVAWLDTVAPYNMGYCPREVVDKLKKLEPRIRTKGWHTCPFCKDATSSTQFLIPVPGESKKFYDVPFMIIHYIEEHEYLPPQEFIDTVMNLEVEDKPEQKYSPPPGGMRTRFNYKK
jgi:hypothetical protein